MALSKPIEGSVARVEDSYTLIINRGAEHGVELKMLFAVMEDDGDPIIDPETNEVIGELPSEKLRVQVSEVHPKYCRAETFATYQPPPVKIPSILGMAGGPGLGPGLDFKLVGIDGLGSDLAKKLGESPAMESLSAAIRYEMEHPRPVRQQISNPDPRPAPKEDAVRREVRVNIGDKVRQIVVTPKRART